MTSNTAIIFYIFNILIVILGFAAIWGRFSEKLERHEKFINSLCKENGSSVYTPKADFLCEMREVRSAFTKLESKIDRLSDEIVLLKTEMSSLKTEFGILKGGN
jgi:hypothetical protein